MCTAGLCVMLAVCAVTASLTSAWGDAYKKGASGATVTEIQTRLKNWGYYSGEVDGMFGSATEKAVKYVQQKNGLTADGVVGAQTLAALGINGGGGDLSGGTQSGDLYLLARLLQPLRGVDEGILEEQCIAVASLCLQGLGHEVKQRAARARVVGLA